MRSIAIKTLLALTALAALGSGALAATAAAHPLVDAPGSGNFVVAGGKALFDMQLKMECSSVSGSGQFTSQATGRMELTFQGCKENVFQTQCRSAGQASGVITTTNLIFHTVTINGVGNDKGLLITTSEGHFASFVCSTVGVSVVIGGNGIIGEITAPGYDDVSETFSTHFGAAGTKQEFKTTEEGGEYYLQSSTNGGAFAEASIATNFATVFTEGEGEFTD